MRVWKSYIPALELVTVRLGDGASWVRTQLRPDLDRSRRLMLGAPSRRGCAACSCRAVTTPRSPRLRHAFYAPCSTARLKYGFFKLRQDRLGMWLTASMTVSSQKSYSDAQCSRCLNENVCGILRCILSKADNCRLDFSVPLAVSSLPDRTECPPTQGFRSPIDNRVGVKRYYSFLFWRLR